MAGAAAVMDAASMSASPIGHCSAAFAGRQLAARLSVDTLDWPPMITKLMAIMYIHNEYRDHGIRQFACSEMNTR
jgi:hypothetical protein